MSELPTRYNSKDSEAKRYAWWEDQGFFRPKSDAQGKKFREGRYVVVIPPPNVTGILHMGHALNNTIQDILVRWNRMSGKDTLWVPGVDHAGIATQNVVEKKLAKEKKTRDDLGREKFLQEVWKWKEEHGSTITHQLRRLGASCDWSRERFTMDEGLSRAVREAFVQLYEKGLIYQGDYIINWCPRCQTALSDEEAAHKEVQGGLYHIKYPVAGKGKRAEKIGEDHIVIATTRPETMLGDTAVAVHPEDERYKHLIGKKLILPLLEREIPVIADELVDPEFGTGMVKVTPAHDPNDFEMGNRHGLERINVMHPDGRINAKGGSYRDMDRFQARKRIIADLETQGLFIKRDSHLHAVGHCYRCDTIVEPYLSKQWFVKMKPLAEKALAAHRKGETVFFPDRWTKVYTNWLENIRDWCISRQIWWGHRIPAWYCAECYPYVRAHLDPQGGELDPSKAIPKAHLDVKDRIVLGNAVAFISREEKPRQCPQGHTRMELFIQDPDVLDTWFSSWLWPFSTLGWPEETEDLRYFYPTSDLATAPEIIFFWVARMIMAGLEFRGRVPFNRIYIHGTVRAQSGLKMSKSLGNAIDPLEVIDEMSADALRFSLIMLSAQDVYLSREKFEVGRNFVNKLWNASRFVMMNLGDFREGDIRENFDLKKLSLAERWILSRLESVSKTVAGQVSSFALAQAASELYHFVWNDFCDWFIEMAKPTLAEGAEEDKARVKRVLFFVLEKSLRLLHPYIPFVTEEIWEKLRDYSKDIGGWPQALMLADRPDFSKTRFADTEAERSLTRMQQAVTSVRDFRTRLEIAPTSQLKVVVVSGNPKVLDVFGAFETQIKKLSRLETLKLEKSFQKDKRFIGAAFSDFEIYVQVEGIVNPEKERVRIRKKIEETTRWVDSLRKRLSDKKFVSHAPREVVEKEKEKLNDAEKILASQKDLLHLFPE